MIDRLCTSLHRHYNTVNHGQSFQKIRKGYYRIQSNTVLCKGGRKELKDFEFKHYETPEFFF